MKLKPVLLLATLAACLLSGCYLNGGLYPVQGPLAARTPPPVLHARMSGAFNSGHLTVTMLDGEVCKGEWDMVNRMQTQGSQKDAAPGPNLSSDWDIVYGQGFYNATILGSRLHVHSILTGNKGTTLYVELYRPDTPNGLNEIKGVATDNNGNVYKLTF
ncbi:MAG TPA: hypothetical protein VMT38_08700 [Terracidiphilus sp.]|nr:hypothetical protein [Terracidiphilus sp.]